MAQSSLLPGSTYRLETFGKLSLTGGAAGVVSHQRRRLALLALLAASGERGVSRDKIVAYLWPESPSELGRHSLEQLLHALRRALGDSVFKGANPVALDSSIVASDVVEFEAALSRGALADAVALYGGPFLHGFYLEEAPEFERWMSTETARLANRYADALSRLAAEAEKNGDHAGRVRWLRRVVEADPVSSRSALALMRALVASGDRTAALQHARIYEALVKQELESDPDPSVTKYAAELRAGGGDAMRAPPPSAARIEQPVQQPTPIAVSTAPPEVASPPALPLAAPTSNERASTLRRPFLWAGAAAIALIILIAAVFTARRNAAPTTDSNRIVVVPFRITSADSSVKYLGEGVADLIAPMLTGEGGPVAVDSRTAISTWNRITRGRDGTAEDARQVARELGAGLALTGAIVEAGGKLTITGNIISRDAGEARALTSVAGPVDSVDKLLDRFVSQLLVRQSGVAETSIASIVSQSLPAIRAYLDGRAAYRYGNQDKAIESFTRAVDIDSTFALAALDLAVATGKLLRSQICRNNACRVYSMLPGFPTREAEDELFRRAIGIAWENRVRLARRDRLLLEALRGGKYPLPNSARETMDDLVHAVRAAPDRPEAQYLLGTLILYQGAALGMSDWLRQAESAFRNASQLDSSYAAPLARLVDVAVLARDTAQVRHAAQVYLAHDSIGETSTYVRWLLAVATRDTVAHNALRSSFRSLDRSTLDHIFLTSQMTGLAVDDADSAAAIIADNASDPLEKSVAFRRLNVLAENRGRPGEATRFLQQMDELGLSRMNFLRFTISSSLFGDGDHAVGDASAREMERVLARDTIGSLSPDDVRRISPSMGTEGFWYLNKGDSVRAASTVAWMRHHAEGQPRNPVMVLLTEMIIASHARHADGARLRARVDSMSLDGCCEFPPHYNSLLARAYEENGEPAAALRTIRRGLWLNPPRGTSSWLREEGRLAAIQGYRDEAIHAYEHYLALRSNPEPVLRPQRDTVRAELDRLRRTH